MNIELQNKAIAIHQELLRSFFVLPEGSTLDKAKYEDITVKYPDNYGGAYYADEKLHICLTDTSTDALRTYSPFADEIVIFEKVAYSYNSLHSLYEYASELSRDEGNDIIIISLYPQKNSIDISVASEKAKDNLTVLLENKGYHTGEFNIVVKDNKPVPCAVYARPGDRVYQWDDNHRYSSIATITINGKVATGVMDLSQLTTLYGQLIRCAR